jgi:hypothetical protein
VRHDDRVGRTVTDERFFLSHYLGRLVVAPVALLMISLGAARMVWALGYVFVLLLVVITVQLLVHVGYLVRRARGGDDGLGIGSDPRLLAWGGLPPAGWLSGVWLFLAVVCWAAVVSLMLGLPVELLVVLVFEVVVAVAGVAAVLACGGRGVWFRCCGGLCGVGGRSSGLIGG